MPIGRRDIPLFKGCRDRQHDIRMLDGFVEELVDTNHHFQFLKRFNHLVAVKILSKRIFRGYPQHSYRRLTGVEDPLRRLVDIQRTIGIFALLSAIADKLAYRTTCTFHADRTGRRLLHHSMVVIAPCLQMAVASATAFNADIAGHCHKSIDRTDVRAAVDMALHTVANPHGGRINGGKFFRQLTNNISGKTTDLSGPLNGHTVAQIGFEFRVSVGIVIDEILINQTFIHQMTRHTQRQSAI